MLQIDQSREKSMIEVIAHRGLSSILPENTMEAIIAGLQCSDYVQFDVLLTKDSQVIVFHDKGLKRLTNICEFPQFKDRKQERLMENNKQKESDWWVNQFTFQELSKLEVRQPCSFRPQLPRSFKISKLDEILQQCLKMKNSPHHRSKLKSGLLIELKSQKINEKSQQDEQLCIKVSQILKKYNLNTKQGCQSNNLPIILSSFNICMLQSMELKCQNEFIQLFKKDAQVTIELLNKIKSNRIRGIGVTQKSLLNQVGKISLRMKQTVKSLGYRLYYWTIRDDDKTNIPFKCKSYDEVYRLLLQYGVDGFITEFPDKCKGIFHIESAQYPADVEQIAEKCLRKQPSKQYKNLSPKKKVSQP